MSASPPAIADLGTFTRDSEPWFRTSLRRLVEIPTVSPGGQRPGDVRAGAAAACELIRAEGGEAELVETSGSPAVIGAFAHPDPRATVLVYNHLDVQPADPATWTRGAPFEMGVEKDAAKQFVYRGRGTTDDKGPALCALRAAAFVAAQKLPITIRFIWETEEEIGSPHFGEVVGARRAELEADGVIVSDSIWPSPAQPVLTAGLRGATQALLRLRTARKPAHSGLVGGVARNPIRELCALATAIDAADFWCQGVADLDPAEVAGFEACGFDPDYFRHAHDLERLETEEPLEMMLRLWTRPTFEIHGLAGGYTGPGLMTTVPESAELKISFRLVPDQDPERIAESLRAFVHRLNPDVDVVSLGRLHPYRAATAGRLHEAIVHGMTEAFGKAPVLVREGGSIGAVPILTEALGTPVHFLPLSLPEHGYHAPDECFDWRQAQGGIEAFARAFAALAAG